jgi:hypothetical protein
MLAPVSSTCAAPSLHGLVLAISSQRAANDFRSAVIALEQCRVHVRGQRAVDILDSAIAKLDEAAQVQSLLSQQMDGPVVLPELIADLAEAIRIAGGNGQPVQVSLHLDHVELEGDTCPYVLTMISEVIADALRQELKTKGGSVGIKLIQLNDGFELQVRHDWAMDCVSQDEIEATSEPNQPIDILAARLGASVERGISPGTTQLTLRIPMMTGRDDEPTEMGNITRFPQAESRALTA